MPIIFLSPSTQEWNSYVTPENNEELVMNQLADRIEPYLRANGIAYVRNEPDRNVGGAITDSNAGDFSVHLALHSNAAPESYAGKLRGIDIYYSPYSESSERLATIIANNLEDIYPLTGKSVSRPTTRLGEVTQTRATAVLCELGYHDNIEDERWLRENLDAIARNLVMSLTDYFGLPFLEVIRPFAGTVDTSGSVLNLRNYPSLYGSVIAQVPDGTNLTIVGSTGEWYVTTYGTATGYVNSAYVSV